MDIIISKHAEKRLRKRAKLPRGAHNRHVHRVFNEGVIVQALNDNQHMLIVYHKFYYIFGLHKIKRCPILLTTYQVPEQHLNAFDVRLQVYQQSSDDPLIID